MNKKGMWIFLSVTLVAVAIITIKAFMPRPIAHGVIEEIVRVEVNTDYGKEDSKLEYIDFIPEKIIECISKYEEQRTLIRHDGYAMKNVQMTILIRTQGGTKEIVIGEDTYSQEGSAPAYRILNEEMFKKEIFDVCGYAMKNAKQSFVGTVLEETTTYMIVKPLNDKADILMGDKVKVEYGTDHIDYLYGIGRRVVIYFEGEPIQADRGMKIIKSDDISTEGFREFELEVQSSRDKEKRMALSGEDIEGFTSFGNIGDTNLYYYGLDKVMITIKGFTMPLETALENGRITLQGLIAKANQDVTDGVISELVYKDGGSQVYRYPEYTIIKYHTLDGNRDVYIGSTDIDIQIADK